MVAGFRPITIEKVSYSVSRYLPSGDGHGNDEQQNEMNGLKRFVFCARGKRRMDQKEVDDIGQWLVIEHRKENMLAVKLLGKEPLERKQGVG
jgi:hypothetical protein